MRSVAALFSRSLAERAAAFPSKARCSEAGAAAMLTNVAARATLKLPACATPSPGLLKPKPTPSWANNFVDLKMRPQIRRLDRKITSYSNG
jgi:hypothetical protein